MNIRQLKQIYFIEQNTNKMKIGKEYICGTFMFYKDRNFLTTIIRITKNKYIFKNYKKDYQGNLTWFSILW